MYEIFFKLGHRHYYQLTSGILESEIDEIDINQSLREMNNNFYIVRDNQVEIIRIQSDSDTSAS